MAYAAFAQFLSALEKTGDLNVSEHQAAPAGEV
jgi:hypothetical protein